MKKLATTTGFSIEDVGRSAGSPQEGGPDDASRRFPEQLKERSAAPTT
jgi:hypothetical protein